MLVSRGVSALGFETAKHFGQSEGFSYSSIKRILILYTSPQLPAVSVVFFNHRSKSLKLWTLTCKLISRGNKFFSPAQAINFAHS